MLGQQSGVGDEGLVLVVLLWWGEPEEEVKYLWGSILAPVCGWGGVTQGHGWKGTRSHTPPSPWPR